MPIVDVRIPNDLKEKMDRHDDINWNELIQRFISSHLSQIELADSIASKSKLTEEDAAEIAKKIKEGMAKKHGLVK